MWLSLVVAALVSIGLLTLLAKSFRIVSGAERFAYYMTGVIVAEQIHLIVTFNMELFSLSQEHVPFWTSRVVAILIYPALIALISLIWFYTRISLAWKIGMPLGYIGLVVALFAAYQAAGYYTFHRWSLLATSWYAAIVVVSSLMINFGFYRLFMKKEWA